MNCSQNWTTTLMTLTLLCTLTLNLALRFLVLMFIIDSLLWVCCFYTRRHRHHHSHTHIQSACFSRYLNTLTRDEEKQIKLSYTRAAVVAASHCCSAKMFMWELQESSRVTSEIQTNKFIDDDEMRMIWWLKRDEDNAAADDDDDGGWM